MDQRRVKVFFDGGCRPNPGRIEAAVVLRGRAHIWSDLGLGDNRDAEWLALIHALRFAQAQGEQAITLIGDAAEVVAGADLALRAGVGHGQALGHAAAFLAQVAQGAPVRVRWIKRAQNLAGIALAARHPR